MEKNIYYVIANTSKDLGHMTPDDIVSEATSSMFEIMELVKDGKTEDLVFEFYKLANTSREAFLCKIDCHTVQEARDSADAIEYYSEVVRDAAAVVQAYLSEKYGDLINKEVIQKIVDHASSNGHFKKKEIKSMISSMIPTPRKKTKRKK